MCKASKWFFIIFIVSIPICKPPLLVSQDTPSLSPIQPVYRQLETMPENALPAILAELHAGFGVVIRPHVTWDDRIIVLLEKDVPSSPQGTGLIKRFSFRELQSQGGEWWVKGEFKKLSIPTIEDVCDSTGQVPKPGIKLAVEYQPDYDGLEIMLAMAFRTYDVMDNVVWYNVPDTVINYLQRSSPNVKIGGYVADMKEFELQLSRELYKYFLIPIAEKSWIQIEDIKKAKLNNKQLIAVLTIPPETPDGKNDMAEELRNMGFDDVITDFPAYDFMALQQAAIRALAKEERKRPKKEEKKKIEYEVVENMVRIPAGYFWMGRNYGEGYSNESPYHVAYLDEFYIDRYNVTIKEYVDFLNTGNNDEHYNTNMLDVATCGILRLPNGRYQAVIGRGDYPVTCVSWEDAAAYAKWAGKRLPTEAEWEKAARGGLVGKKYATGDYFSHKRANYYGRGYKDYWDYTALVGQFPPNGYGLYDMCGNVWDRVEDYYHPDFYSADTMYNPVNYRTVYRLSPYRIIRGGSWADDDEMDSYLRVASRGPNYPVPGNWINRIGIRCASSAQPSKEHRQQAALNYCMEKMKKNNPDLYGNMHSDSLKSIVLQKQMQSVDFFYEGDIQTEVKSILHATIYSMVLPGSGELYTGRLYSGLFFLGVEIAGWSLLLTNKAKSNDIDTQYRDFARQHFSSSRYETWLQNYHDTHNNQDPPSYTYKELFYFGSKGYYYSIGTHDQFLAGWDDFDPNIGLYGGSENRTNYREVSEARKRLKDRHDKKIKIAGMVIVGNHIASVIDTIWGIKRHTAYRSRGLSWDVEHHILDGGFAPLLNFRYRW